jgi:hypothetical protein
MRKPLLRRPSPALAVSFVALVVALGGTAYAGITIPKGSVGTNQLKNKAVTNAKLGPGTVGTAKIKNGAVTASKINTSGLTVPNATTAAALSGVQIVTGPTIANNPGQQNSQVVACPTGMKAISGGIEDSGGIDQSVNELFITSSSTFVTNNLVAGTVNNTSTTNDATFQVSAVCINATTSGTPAVRSHVSK